MDFVFPTYAPGACGPFETLAALARQGARAVEWNVAGDRFADETRPEHVEVLCEAQRRTGMRINSVHTPFGERADIASPHPDIRDQSFAMQRTCIALARRVGARYLVVHPGQAPRGPQIAHRLGLAVEMLGDLEPLARQAGVILALENLPSEYPGNGAAEVLRLVEAIDSPYVRVCFDSGHAHLCGDLPGIARALLPYAVTMHLHDNDGWHDQHLLPGRGRIDWPEFASIYRETGCTAPAMLECKPPDGWRWPESLAEVRALLGE